ncbi:MAG TPA: hypothetical protein VGO55_00900 [Allosphingosinicella sp.]|jgi:hypothetical protein|nr:hypothetical protein [Allosphingosinicella sp.]
MARGGGLLVWMKAHKARTRGARSGLISSLIAQIIAPARSGEPAPVCRPGRSRALDPMFLMADAADVRQISLPAQTDGRCL